MEISHISGIGIYVNEFENLPNSIGKLKNMSRLEIVNTNLNKIPSEIGGLKLVILDLTNNNITDIPKSLKMIGDLEYFYLQDNPVLDNPDYEVMKTLLDIKSNAFKVDFEFEIK